MPRNLREELAALEHKQGAHWTKYMLDTIRDAWIDHPDTVDSPDALDDFECVKGWRRQIGTPYEDLTEKEKDSDREWADKALQIIDELRPSPHRMLQNWRERQAGKALPGSPVQHCPMTAPPLMVLPGGPGPVPGTEKARAQGCICPGKVGDVDQFGQEGYTVDRECPQHGVKARKLAHANASIEWLNDMHQLEEQARHEAEDHEDS